jgi:hypothetical protein
MQVINYNNQDINGLIMQSLSKLDNFQQLKLLDFIISLVGKKDTNPEKLLRYAGAIDKKDISLMKAAIEDGCEKVDNNEW